MSDKPRPQAHLGIFDVSDLGPSTDPLIKAETTTHISERLQELGEALRARDSAPEPSVVPEPPPSPPASDVAGD